MCKCYLLSINHVVNTGTIRAVNLLLYTDHALSTDYHVVYAFSEHWCAIMMTRSIYTRRFPGPVHAMLSPSLPSVCSCLIFRWYLRASVGLYDVQLHVTAASFGPILTLG